MQSMGEYSEFTLEELGMKFANDTEYTIAGAVGSLEETLSTKTVSKKYKGIEVKTRTKGDGTGELKISWHMNYELYKKAYGMNLEGFATGVYGYGQTSMHKTFALTALIYDEDDVKKLKSYPNCIIKDGISRKIENGGEEVAEIEMTIAVMPDDDRNAMYEALYDSLDEAIASAWMKTFNANLIKVKTV